MTIDVSLLLDGELSAAQTAESVHKCADDTKLRDRYTLYALTGDAMRGVPFPDDGFSRRIFERMRREGVRMEAGFDPLEPASKQ
jgi:negative regulator of sigma E activity